MEMTKNEDERSTKFKGEENTPLLPPKIDIWIVKLIVIINKKKLYTIIQVVYNCTIGTYYTNPLVCVYKSHTIWQLK